MILSDSFNEYVMNRNCGQECPLDKPVGTGDVGFNSNLDSTTY